jgi:hypothetical protein
MYIEKMGRLQTLTIGHIIPAPKQARTISPYSQARMGLTELSCCPREIRPLSKKRNSKRKSETAGIMTERVCVLLECCICKKLLS